jgi:hypothetical protein
MRSVMLGLGMVGSLALTPRVTEPHPHMRAAVVELEQARNELRTAAHDFGGHRVQALKAVDAAIKQLKLAQQYDTK